MPPWLCVLALCLPVPAVKGTGAARQGMGQLGKQREIAQRGWWVGGQAEIGTSQKVTTWLQAEFA